MDSTNHTRGSSSQSAGEAGSRAGLPLIARLEAMQQHATRLLLISGVASLLSGGAAALLGLFALDWLFHFPGVLRFVFGLAWLSLTAWLIARYLWPPLARPFSCLHLATKVEERFEQFQDRLTSAVSFISEDYTVGDPLQMKLIERTEQIAQDVPMEQVISTRAAWRLCLLAGVSVSAMISIAVLQPLWMRTACQRLLLPSVPVPWPRSVHIAPLTGSLTIAAGESVVVAMEVTKGQSEFLRGYLHVRRARKPVERVVMHRQGPARYAWTLNSVTEDIDYWFSGGDDSTADSPGRIRVVDRPRVTDLRMAVRPPPYTGAAATPLPTGQESVDLIEGSTLSVSFRSSKPLGRDDTGKWRAWISCDSEAPVFAEVDDRTPSSYRATLEPGRTGTYRIHLIDRHGFENREEDGVLVAVHQDTPPTASIVSPVETLEVTRQATVEIVGTISDDLGISRIELTGRLHQHDKRFRHPITQWTTKHDRDGQVTAHVATAWSLRQINPDIGDTVEYSLAAADNRSTADRPAQLGRSHKMRLKVVSERHFAAGIAEDIGRLAQRLQRSLAQQEQLIDETDLLHDTMQQSPAVNPDQDLLKLSAHQRGIAQRMGVIRRQVEDLAAALQRNGIEQGREKQQADLVEFLKALTSPEFAKQ